MSCHHPHGDFVNGYWLCGRCYEKLAERPSRHMPVAPVSGGDIYGRQTVVHAEIRRGQNGLTLSEFIGAAVLRVVFLTKGAMSGTEAIDYAIDLLRIQGAEFGDPEYVWDTAGAHDLVSEDAQHWDETGTDGNNGEA